MQKKLKGVLFMKHRTHNVIDQFIHSSFWKYSPFVFVIYSYYSLPWKLVFRRSNFKLVFGQVCLERFIGHYL